jgi:hypothetical protein
MGKSRSTSNKIEVSRKDIGLAAHLMYYGFKIQDIIIDEKRDCFIFANTARSRSLIRECEDTSTEIANSKYFGIVAWLRQKAVDTEPIREFILKNAER